MTDETPDLDAQRPEPVKPAPKRRRAPKPKAVPPPADSPLAEDVPPPTMQMALHEPPQADDGAPPLIRSGLRGFLELTGRDVLIALGLTVLAFVLRIASPVDIAFFAHPGTGSAITVYWVDHTYNRDAGACKAVPDPRSGDDINGCGQVFDEVYFPTDTALDLGRYQSVQCTQQWDPVNCAPETPGIAGSVNSGAVCQAHPDPDRCAVSTVSYFDPEPPLTKLMMAPSLHFLGFDTWGWRMSQVVFGSLLCGLLYLIALRLRRDRFFAAVASLLVVVDGLAFAESRIGVIDIIAVFFAALLYYLFLLHWQARTRVQWRVTLYAMAAAAGLAFAAKLTALAPAVVVIGLLGGRLLAPWMVWLLPGLGRLSGPRRHETLLWHEAAGRRPLVHYVAGLVLVGAIFCCSFARYLTIPHEDVYRFIACDPAVPGLTTATPATDSLPVPVTAVAGHKVLDPVRAVADIADVTSAELQYHKHECHGHPYASRWYSWPLMIKPVLFYSSSDPLPDGSGSGLASMNDMGNPAIWWLGIPALLFCVWRMLWGPMLLRVGVGALGVASLAGMIVIFRSHELPLDVTTAVEPGNINPLPLTFTLSFIGMFAFNVFGIAFAVISRRFVPSFIVVGYVTAWLMWEPGNEARVLFFYHALGMLIFLALGYAYTLAAIRNQVLVVGRRVISLAPIAYAALGVVLAGFIFFYPVWTALPQPAADHEMRVWVDTW
jgi:hypothetical protein